MKHLTCDQCRERWDESIDKSTFEASVQSADVRAHLESCADCRKKLNLLVAARQELQQLPSQKAPVSLRANILSQIEKPQNVPWWNSLLVSPRRLTWASGAIVAIFVVALLMRPERQTQVLQIEPKVLSNRGQIEEHNSISPQQSVAPPKETNDSSAKKVRSQKPHAKSTAPQRLRDNPVKSRFADALKPKQIHIASASKPVSDSDQNLPRQRKEQPLQNAAPRKNVVSQPQHFASPSAINNDSITNEQTPNGAAGVAKFSSPNFAIQSDSASRAIAPKANEVQNSVGETSAFKMIHWSNIITSDYDVANAKIIVTLEDGLTFADDSPDNSSHILWQGTLLRGKQIPLNIDLRSDSNEAAKLHLVMIDTDTQKLLLDKVFDVK